MKYVYLLRSIPHPNQRYVGVTSDPESRLAAHNAGRSPHTTFAVDRIIIPPGAKSKIRRQLGTAGITDGVMSPELSGLSSEIREGWSYDLE